MQEHEKYGDILMANVGKFKTEEEVNNFINNYQQKKSTNE